MSSFLNLSRSCGFFIFLLLHFSPYFLHYGNTYTCMVLMPKVIIIFLGFFLPFCTSAQMSSYSQCSHVYLWFHEIIFYVLFSTCVEILYSLKHNISLLKINMYSLFSNPLWTYCSFEYKWSVNIFASTGA